jgi:hypothetical protein
MKVGAFTACPICRFAPTQPEDLAKSVLLSDQASDPAALNSASEQLRAGGSVDFDQEAVAQWVATIQTHMPDLRMPLGCAIVWYAPLLIMALLALAFALVAALAYMK